MRLRAIAVFVSAFLIASTVSAATYYVSPTGNDAASGAANAPFRTITRAARAVAPGDVVNVRGGVYTDRVSISSKGTAAARIVFRSMPGEAAILDGSALTGNTSLVSLYDTNYVDLQGFEIRNSTYIGVAGWQIHNTRILDNHIHHTTRNGIYVGGDMIGECSDITVSGNRIHDTVLENQYHAMNGGWAGALVVSKTNRATITNNRVYNNDGEGIISLRSNYATIRGNELSDNYSGYIYLDNARFATVDRNLVYSTGNTRYFRDGKPGIGIGVANETADNMNPSTDNVFTNNIVVGTRWGFFYGNYETGGGLKNTKVLHNTFYGTADDIIRIDDDAHANSVVANNIFFQTGSVTPRWAGTNGVKYQSNLWYGGTAGAAAGTGDLYANPLFVKAGGRTSADYRLHPLSPAVHTAMDLPGVGTDFFGDERSPAADIGAHEQSLSLGSSAPVTPSLPAPSAVAARLAGNTTVRVTWAPVKGAASYNVYRNGQFFGTVDTNDLTDTTVAPATAYSYEIASRDVRGTESMRSAASTVSIPATSVKPDSPQGTQAIASSSRVTLSWNAVNGATGYLVLRDGAAMAETQSTTFIDANVNSATTYSYAIVAVNASGAQSAASEKIQVTTTSAGRRRSVR